MFDCIVIGKGLIGSAAAKYLKGNLEHVAIIGPDEPQHDLEKVQVFASHYDQSRVQRIIGVDSVWTQLNKQSAAHYPKLESESGISFHTPEGCFYAPPYGRDKYLKAVPIRPINSVCPINFLKTNPYFTRPFQTTGFPPVHLVCLSLRPQDILTH